MCNANLWALESFPGNYMGLARRAKLEYCQARPERRCKKFIRERNLVRKENQHNLETEWRPSAEVKAAFPGVSLQLLRLGKITFYKSKLISFFK